MQSTATTPEAYMNNLPEDRKEPMGLLRNSIRNGLPPGFEETISYGMITYVIPHSTYPAGYHCNPQQALPFLSIASQKNFIALYHMGIYANEKLLNWFVQEYQTLYAKKPDMGKSCIRFKHMEKIPFGLIGELSSKITPQQWIAIYEKEFKKQKSNAL